jgi:hypothetical protein
MRIKPCKYAAVLLVFLGTGLWAQQALQLRWRLYHTSGAVSLHSAEGQIIPVGEIFLEYGDMIQTTGGEAELQLVFGGVSRADYTLLKLGENTSIRIGEEKGGSPSIELLYGRIRLVSGIASGRIVSVLGGASQAEFKNADAGIDYMILSKSSASSQPVLMVHMFRGSGELLPVRESLLDLSRLPLRDGQTMMAEFNTPLSYVERRSLDADVINYWDRRGFSGAAPLAIPGVLLPRTESIPKTEESGISFTLEPVQDTSEGMKDTAALLLRNKKIGIGIGLLFVAAGIGMQAFSACGNDLFGDAFLSRDAKTFLSAGAYSSMGLGSVFLLSLVLNDP